MRQQLNNSGIFSQLVCSAGIVLLLFLSSSPLKLSANPEISAILYNVSSIGANDGAIALEISGQNPPFSIQWSDGSQTDSISNLYAGLYLITVSDAMGLSSLDTFWLESPLPATWNLSITGVKTYVIPIATCFTFNLNAVPGGSLIKLFSENGGVESVFGYGVWNGTSLSCLIYESDPGMNNGYLANNPIEITYFNHSLSQEFQAYACISMHIQPIIGLFGYESLSQISCIQSKTSFSQIKNFTSGWDGFALTVDHPGLSAAEAFAGYSSIKVVKNDHGDVYWPQFGIDQIPELIIGKGYTVYSSTATSVEIPGKLLIPNIYTLQIPVGWSSFGYFGATQVQASQFFYESNYNQNYVIIIKSITGEIWWPIYQLGMFNLKTGHSYRIKSLQPLFKTLPPLSCNTF